MGGLIKITIKENNILTTVELETAFLNAQYAALGDLYSGITSEQLMIDAEGDLSDNLVPTSYGHIFIDRDKKHIFNLNDYSNFNTLYLAKVKNNLEIYEINKEPEYGDDPRYKHTNNSFLYNLQNCIDSSDKISFIGANDFSAFNIVTTNEKDALTLAKDFIKLSNINSDNFTSYYILFSNSEWIIENHFMSLNNTILFQKYLEENNIEFDKDEFDLFIKDYE